MKLLQIDASARDGSVSRAMTAQFVAAWKQAHPQGQVIRRDLAALPLAHISDVWVDANNTAPEQRSAAQRQVLALSDQLIEELFAADVIVLGSPMYNFGISAGLKAWIDLVVRQGETVDFGMRPPKGLLQDKTLVVITARGGSYAAGSPTAAFDFQEPYLRHILDLMGLTDPTFIHADRQLYGEEIAALARHEADAHIGRVVTNVLQSAVQLKPRVHHSTVSTN